MMEESSDESAEIVDKDEAVNAEQHFTAQQSTAVTSSNSVSPPVPLPSFLTQPSAGVSTATPTIVPTTTTPAPPPVTSSVASPPTASPVSAPVSVQSPSPASPGQVVAPGPQESPYEASSAITVPADIEMEPVSPAGQQAGLFGWFSGSKIVSKVMEKTKSSVESMITTLDPGMKEVIHSGGDVCILATTTSESKLSAVREAFQQTFGRATVVGKASEAKTAAQPVGFTAGLKGAQERIQNLRQTENIPDDQPVVSIEGFIVEMLPDRWYEMSCLVLQDPQHRIDLQTFSQPSPIPAEYILKVQDRTPKDYPLRWAGLGVTIGQIVEEENPHIGHVNWQSAIVGVSRRESLFLAAKSLAYMYQKRLPTTFVS